MSIESEIRELDIEQRKYNKYSTEWRKIEDKKDGLKRKRKRDEDDNEDDDSDIAALAAVGILSGLSDVDISDSSGSDSSSSVDFGGGDSGGGGFGGDF